MVNAAILVDISQPVKDIPEDNADSIFQQLLHMLVFVLSSMLMAINGCMTRATVSRRSVKVHLIPFLCH
jgi:hypothetical protein